MPPQLVALSDGPNILLDKPILLVGRHHECDIQISSRKISRKHCCIAQVNDRLVVRDLFSTNGISINGVRVLEGSLKSGDELTIANFRYQVALNPDDIAHQESVPESPLPKRDPLDSCEEPIALSESDAKALRLADSQRGLAAEPIDPPSASGEHSVNGKG
jgi:pSer/pThr/pTyr-binding forkhead associated (FHA) protein